MVSSTSEVTCFNCRSDSIWQKFGVLQIWLLSVSLCTCILHSQLPHYSLMHSKVFREALSFLLTLLKPRGRLPKCTWMPRKLWRKFLEFQGELDVVLSASVWDEKSTLSPSPYCILGSCILVAWITLLPSVLNINFSPTSTTELSVTENEKVSIPCKVCLLLLNIFL